MQQLSHCREFGSDESYPDLALSRLLAKAAARSSIYRVPVSDYLKQHFLYLSPLPQWHGSFRPSFIRLTSLAY